VEQPRFPVFFKAHSIDQTNPKRHTADFLKPKEVPRTWTFNFRGRGRGRGWGSKTLDGLVWMQAAIGIVLFLMLFGIAYRVFVLFCVVVEKIRELCDEQHEEQEPWDELKWLEGAEVTKAFATGLPMKHFIHGNGFAVAFDQTAGAPKPYRVSFYNGLHAKYRPA
jgi:hypothetical protein